MQEWLEAQGDPEREKVVVNTRFGEAYERKGNFESHEQFMRRRENYGAELPEGVLIRLPAAAKDRALLVDRDACGHIKLWHAEGTTQLSDAQLTDIVLSALPEGGPRLRLNGYYAKAFVGKLGVTVTLWKAPPRK